MGIGDWGLECRGSVVLQRLETGIMVFQNYINIEYFL